MDFFNPEVDLAQLPAAEAIQWQPVDKQFRIVLRFIWLLASVFFLLVITAIIYFSPGISLTGTGLFLLAGWLLLSGVWLFIRERSFPTRAYAIREHDILYKQGWIVERTYACPINRIQHCSVLSGPLDRKYGLAVLSLNTAGSGDADMKISGLPEAVANELREFILKKIAADAL